MRKAFNDLESAKKEALFVAQRIQSGMQHVTDLKPHEHDSFKAAVAMLEKTGIPLVAAIEDYTRARELAGTESLAAMASEYGRYFKKVVRRVTIPEIVAEMLLHREQDGASKVVATKNLYVDMMALTRALKIEWPRNVLRHSFISYRIASVKSADQVALEAGNSPSIIFKHYRY
jgi:hypothetical protein